MTRSSTRPHHTGVHYQQRGQVAILFALVFSFVLFPLTIFEVNMAVLFTQDTDVQAAALASARAGAGVPDVAYFLSTGVSRLGSGSTAACQSAGNTAMSGLLPGGATLSVSCTKSSSTTMVSVITESHIPMPLISFGTNMTLTATATASIQAGTTRACTSATSC